MHFSIIALAAIVAPAMAYDPCQTEYNTAQCCLTGFRDTDCESLPAAPQTVGDFVEMCIAIQKMPRCCIEPADGSAPRLCSNSISTEF